MRPFHAVAGRAAEIPRRKRKLPCTRLKLGTGYIYMLKRFGTGEFSVCDCESVFNNACDLGSAYLAREGVVTKEPKR